MSETDTYQEELRLMVVAAEKQRQEQELKEQSITKVSLDQRMTKLEKQMEQVIGILTMITKGANG